MTNLFIYSYNYGTMWTVCFGDTENLTEEMKKVLNDPPRFESKEDAKKWVENFKKPIDK